MRAILKPYSSQPAEISVSRRGCAIQDFGLTLDNSISGRVLDEGGQPLEKAKVGLVDLDHPTSNPNGRASFADAYVNRSDMTFEFKNVPTGRFLLMFNPEGPGHDTRFDLPFESTYYPPGATRATAKVLEIKSSGVHLTGMDLVVGKPVEFRPVVVRVRFPDRSEEHTSE